MNEVVVTGLGVLSCLGIGRKRFWNGMIHARSTPQPLDDPHANVRTALLYPVPDREERPATATRFALRAAEEAVRDARLADADPRRIAVVVGTGMGESAAHEARRVSGELASEWTPTFSVGAAIGELVGARGPNTTVSNACAASGYAISVAADLIRSGEADVVIAGGAEAYSRVGLGCFDRLGAIDPQRCRPFDRNRAGTVFGEGAAVLVVESASRARARGARAYAALAGEGWSCDAFHNTAPEPTGAEIRRSMRQAMTDAGVVPGDIGLVVPHGTGTELNDAVEAEALHDVMGTPPSLYSLKALIGHTGGAAGAMGVLAAALITHSGWVPPNVPLADPDTELGLSLPENPARLSRPAVVVNAYAFGGNNVSLVLKKAV